MKQSIWHASSAGTWKALDKCCYYYDHIIWILWKECHPFPTVGIVTRIQCFYKLKQMQLFAASSPWEALLGGSVPTEQRLILGVSSEDRLVDLDALPGRAASATPPLHGLSASPVGCTTAPDLGISLPVCPYSQPPFWRPQGFREMKSNSSISQIRQGLCLSGTESLVRTCPIYRLSQKITQKHKVRLQISGALRKALIQQGVLRSWNSGDRRYPHCPTCQQPIFLWKTKKKKKAQTFPNKVMTHAICGFKLLGMLGSYDIHCSYHSTHNKRGSPGRMSWSLWCAPGDYKWIGNMLCRWNPTFSWLTTLALHPSLRLLPAGLLLCGLRHRKSSRVAL